MGNSNPV